jgi:hypothetical protein
MTKGHNIFTVEYSETSSNEIYHTVDIDQTDIDERVKTLQAATGKTASDTDLRNIIIRLIAEVRAGVAKLSPSFNYTGLIDVDLETDAAVTSESVEKTKTLEIKPLTATITPLKVLDEKPTVNTETSETAAAAVPAQSNRLKTLITKIVNWWNTNIKRGDLHYD